jgi:hypothetical protein
MLARGRAASAWRANVPPMVPHIQAGAAEQRLFSDITAGKETPSECPATGLVGRPESPRAGL